MRTKEKKQIEVPKKPRGRPSKYTPQFAEIAKRLAIKGLIDKEIYEIIGISEPIGIAWKKKYQDFDKSLKEGKEIVDHKVVSALYQNALGGEYEAEKAVVVSDGQLLGSHVEVVKVKERIPPNVTAQIYWTKNRLPKEWSDRTKVDIGNDNDDPFIIEIK